MCLYGHVPIPIIVIIICIRFIKIKVILNRIFNGFSVVVKVLNRARTKN